MTTNLLRDTASFRDPRGSIYHCNGRVFRTVMPLAEHDFFAVRSTGLIQQLILEEKLLPEIIFRRGDRRSPLDGPITQESTCILEHPRIPFISYPYEWSFAALKSAALLQLDILLQALEKGVTLTDASAFNIQFQGAQPIFIDHLAFRCYRAGEIWQGHRQFCEQFLNPLLLRACTGVAHNNGYRGALEGISTAELNRLIPWHKKLSFNIFMHVVLHASLQKKSTLEAEKKAQKIILSASSFKNILVGLQNWLKKIQPAKSAITTWQSYSEQYQLDKQAPKALLVTEFIKTVKPKLMFDLGCNTGFYSKLALQAGAGYVIGFESDQGALDRAFKMAQDEGLMFLPLYMDLANPTPNQGWAEIERKGFLQRGPADAVLALAVVHHLAIARNIPLVQLLDWLLDLAPQGLVEFVPKSDPLLQRLLYLREDIFADYTEENFLAYIKQRADIVKSEIISDSGRSLVWYKKK